MAASIAELDGANVLFKTSNSPSNNFGRAGKKRITALAICEYQDAPGEIYLFACDRHWKVIGDLLYSSVQEAKNGAESYYEATSINWMQPT
ncbi:MAG: hypothetical protein OEQ39_03235 [Gammaproteobacteria bacterium]|nr:hypothetical protein [Gammaproteobacteria bacterium]